MSHAKFCLVSHLGCPIYTNTECKKADKTKSQGEALSSLSHRPLSRLPCAEKYVTCEFHDNTEYRPCCLSCVKTLFQLGLPALVLDLRPVTRSRFSFSCIRSRASCRPTAFMSVRCRADVMYLIGNRAIFRVRLCNLSCYI